MSSARSVAVRVISEIERSCSYSNLAADSAISEAKLTTQDAALASALIYGVLQRKITLDAVLAQYAGKAFKKTHPFVLSNLRVAAYQILFMDKIPQSAAVNEAVKIVKKSKQSFAAGFSNAVLRKITADKENILNSIENSNNFEFKYSCPKELADSLINDYGLQLADGFLKASLESPELYCRKNPFAGQLHLSDELLEKGGVAENGKIDGSFILRGAGNIEKLESFKKGEFFVQDLASQTAISSFDIRNGMSFLDVCAAPGGKSFTAAGFVGIGGKIVSCDLYERRTGLISAGAKRLKIENLTAVQNDATVFNPKLGLFDRVLCDVPCSGLGVIRRKPEIKYKNLTEFSDLPKIQLEILETSVKYLKPDGLLMYSTCTLRNAENIEVVSEFFKAHADFEILNERTLMPNTDGTDGFYFCILKRR